jgi:hypothetical protein
MPMQGGPGLFQEIADGAMTAQGVQETLEDLQRQMQQQEPQKR